MCIMHAPINTTAPKIHKYKKRVTAKRTPFNKRLLRPDPDFIDERKIAPKVEDKGFFAKLFN